MVKVTYYVQRYRPHMEATSKEINVLQKHFKGKLHDLHLNGYFDFFLNKKETSHHFIWYPLRFPLVLLNNRNRVNHIYTGLPDSVYLPTLPHKNLMLTYTNYCPSEFLIKKKKSLNNVKKIVVESPHQAEELYKAEIDGKKIEIIHPSVDLEKFSFNQTRGGFKILNATCPTKMKDLHKRGILLQLAVAKMISNKRTMKFTFLWRYNLHLLFRKLKDNYSNVNFVQKIVKDMNQVYAQYHCTIIPYIKFDSELKVIPLSAIESLAAGKPLLVSNLTGLAEIVKKEKCGVVFEPGPKSLIKAITELKHNYHLYQKNCRKVAEKYFSQEEFVRKYRDLYLKLNGENIENNEK